MMVMEALAIRKEVTVSVAIFTIFTLAERQMIPGDHIYYSCGSYSHHGIYCGDISYNNRNYKNVVIHFEGKHRRGQIRGIDYNQF
ncbi:MAG TPA: hypothetical protein V6C63_16330, partial [Allocoleopsis sp.]